MKLELVNKWLINIKNNIAIQINQILEISNLIDSKVLLLLGEGNIPYPALGGCTPKIIFRYTNDPDYLRQYSDGDWDFGITISEKVCDNYNNCRAYFSYILGHELGHAIICNLDFETYLFSYLIRKYIQKVSQNKIIVDYKFPDELICDKYGIFVSEKIHGRKVMDCDLNKMKLYINDKTHLDFLSELKSSNEIDIKDLKRQLLNMAEPYKEELITCWERDAIENNKGIASFVKPTYPDFCGLFESG